MGLGGLALVSPGKYHVKEARMLAASAKDVLEAAPTFDTLEEALAGQEVILGTSRRVKSGRIRIMTPEEGSDHLLGNLSSGGGRRGGSGKASLVFGSIETFIKASLTKISRRNVCFGKECTNTHSIIKPARQLKRHTIVTSQISPCAHSCAQAMPRQIII